MVVTYDGRGVDGRGVDGPALCTGVSVLLGNDKILSSSLRLACFCLGPGLIGKANLFPITKIHSYIMVYTYMQKYYTLYDNIDSIYNHTPFTIYLLSHYTPKHSD